jgi:hypothetical protein
MFPSLKGEYKKFTEYKEKINGKPHVASNLNIKIEKTPNPRPLLRNR